jgi:hypothetical protein
MTTKKTALLLILDGWGHRVATDGNAIALANTPAWDQLRADCPHALIDASGEEVVERPGRPLQPASITRCRPQTDSRFTLPLPGQVDLGAKIFM